MAPGACSVHIGTSPYEVVDRFLGEGEIGGRAAEAREVLDRLTDLEVSTTHEGARRAHWRAVADANSKVKSTLAPLEGGAPGAAGDLLHHAWVSHGSPDTCSTGGEPCRPMTSPSGGDVASHNSSRTARALRRSLGDPEVTRRE